MRPSLDMLAAIARASSPKLHDLKRRAMRQMQHVRRQPTHDLEDSAITRALIGAAAGVAGTFFMQAVLAGEKKWAPGTMSPIRKDPGAFMVQQAERAVPPRVRQHVPQAVESAAAMGLQLGYGSTFGALFGALCGRPKNVGETLVGGALLGLVTWAVGYLGWLPAMGLMPPVWRQTRKQALTPAGTHAMFGIATVAAYCGIECALDALAED